MIPGSLVLAWILGVGPIPDAERVERDVREILSDRRYAFCDRDATVGLDERDRAWCPLVDRDNPRCPGLAVHCAAPTTAAGGSTDFDPREGRGRDGGAGRFNEGAGGDDPAQQTALRVDRSVSTLSQVLLWTLAIGGLAWLIFVLLRNRGRDDETEAAQAPSGDALVDPLFPGDADRNAVETDVHRLLERARRRADQGEFRRAVDDVYAALLRRLAGDGLIEIHRARTNGDYLRDLRERPNLRNEVQTILREVERVQFGRLEPDAGVFVRLIDRVAPLVGRSLAGLVLLLLPILGPLVACGLSPDEHDGLAGLGTGATGTRAVVQLLRRHDQEAHHRVRTLAELEQTKGAILLLGDVAPSTSEWSALLAWVDHGGTLIVATRDGDLPPELGMGIVHGASSTPIPSDALWSAPEQHELPFREMRVPRLSRLERRAPSRPVQPLLVRPGPDDSSELYAAQVMRGEGRVLAFADELLFTNASLAVDENAELVVQLLGGHADGLEVVDAWTGTGPQNPIESVEHSMLGLVLLQLLALVATSYLWRGMAFGRLVDPARPTRRAFVEHVQALALQYAKARASRHALSSYAAWVMDRLRDRVAPGTRRGLLPLAQGIAARTGRDEAEVMRVLVEAHGVRESAAAASGVYSARKRDMDLMRALTDLLASATRPRRKR